MFQTLSKTKRTHLVLVALGTLLAIGGLGFGLIRNQYAQLGALAAQTAEASKKLGQMREALQHAEETKSRLGEVSDTLAANEADMGAGDLYSWGLDVLRRFRAAYKVDVPAVNQPVIGECTLLPKFPYKQAAFTLGGTAHYHDLGRFLADFENQFPHLRIVGLNLSPAASLVGAEKEKLEFKLEIVALVRPNQN